MPTFELTSAKTGQNYEIDFDRDPNDQDIDEAIAQFDTEFYNQQGLSPSIAKQGPAMTGARSFMQLGTNMVEGVVGGGARILGAMENAAADTLGTDRPGTFQPAAQFADAIGESGRDFWATNPANPIAQTVGGGAGQALTMLGTAGASAPLLGTKLAMTAVPIGLGAVQGGGAGVKTAQDMGIDNPFGQLGLGAAFAGAEAITERMGGIGGKAAAEMLQTGVKATLKQAAKSIGSEAIEEPISGTLQDAATFAVGQTVADPARPGYTANGYQLPALDADFLNRRKMEAIGGAAGGTVFAGLQLAGTQAQNSGQPTPPPAPTATDPNSMAAIAARAGSQDVQWQTPPDAQTPQPATASTRQPILANVPDAQPPTAPVTEPAPPAARQPILTNVPDAPIRIGETVAYEGYTGTLIADGARYAIQVPNGPLVEVADTTALARATAAPQPAPQPSPAPTQTAAPSPLPQLPDPQVSEATFNAAQDGSMAIQTADGQTFIPHNPQLLRTVRTGPNGLEVLVRKPSDPGRIIKLVGAQAQSAQDAFLNAAANVEAAGGKVNWGSAQPRLSIKPAPATTQTPSPALLAELKNSVGDNVTDANGSRQRMRPKNAAAFEAALAQDNSPVAEALRALPRESTGHLVLNRDAMNQIGLAFKAENNRLQASQPRLSTQFKGGLPSLRKAVNEARNLVNQYMPGLIGPKTLIFTTPQEFLDSGAIDPATLSPEELANLETAEGFFDNTTGHTIIIASNVAMRPGESPRAAIARVLLHERVGHEGINALIQSDASFAQKWDQLAQQIPTPELDAIATEPGYTHLASDRAQLALEWLARQTETLESARNAAAIEGGLKGLAKQMWQALKEFLNKAFQAYSVKAQFRHDITGLITQARNAALNGTADPTTPNALVQRIQFSLGGSKILHTEGTPYRVNDRAWRSILFGSALPKAFTETIAATERERIALDQTAAQIGKDLDAAAEAHAKASGLPIAKVYEMLNQAMSGAPGTNSVLMQTAPVLSERARRARNFVDDLSQAIAATLPTGYLKNSIILNQGAWMKRSYAAFDPASGWNYDAVMSAAAEGRDIAGRSARDIVAKAMKFLRAQSPQATRAEIEATMRDLMDRDTWSGYMTGKAAVRKNVSSLMERASIPVEIRDLMGEEHNPIKRLAQSVSFQAQFIHRHQGQTALRNIGLNNGLFKSARGGVYTVEIPKDNPKWSPLAGLHTTPQLWKTLQDIDGVTTGTDLGTKALEALKWLGSEAKFNRVASNPDSWLVNMLGNVVALVQTGDVFYSSIFRRVGEAVALHRAGRPKAADMVNVATEAVTDAQRALVARLTASGVLGESFTLKDLEASLPRHLLQWVADDSRADRILGGVKGAIWGQAAGRGFGAPGRIVGGAIGAVAGSAKGYAGLQAMQQTVANYVMTGPDAIARLTGFLGNYETAIAAGMTLDDAFTHASERTRNTFPDYGKLPPIMKTLSRYGIMGSFIGFQFEVYRNTIWNLRYAGQDLRSGNPALVRKGAARTLGASIVGVLAAGGLQAIFQNLAGTDDDRNKKWRKWFAAPWEKNGVIVFTKYAAEGVSYFNTSYLIPQATITELYNAAASGRDPMEAAGNLVAHVWEQFMGSSVHLGPIIAAATNNDRMGRPLTYQSGIPGALERIDGALAPIMEPGWTAKLERLEYAMRGAEKRGRLHSVDEEAKRLVGIREFTRTWPDMVKRAYDALQARNSAIRSQANKVLGLNLPGAKTQAIQEANAALEQLAKDTADFEADLDLLQVPENIIKAARRDSSIPKKFAPVEIDPDTQNRVRSVR
jgi:hypothetical protein